MTKYTVIGFYPNKASDEYYNGSIFFVLTDRSTYEIERHFKNKGIKIIATYNDWHEPDYDYSVVPEIEKIY
jgi:hypothetical protein